MHMRPESLALDNIDCGSGLDGAYGRRLRRRLRLKRSSDADMSGIARGGPGIEERACDNYDRPD